MLRKIHGYILTASVLAFSFSGIFAAAAAEKWRTVIWSDDAIAGFDALCAEKGLTSPDVFELNGWLDGKLPANGEELLVPESQRDRFATWMEVQNRTGGGKPLVTVKLHGVPASMRGQAVALPSANLPEPPAEEVPAEPAGARPVKPDSAEIGTEPVENMTTAAPGDEIVQQTPDDELQDQILSSILDPALASQDIIIPNPPVLKPMIGPPAVTHGKMMWPVSGKVTSGFGRRGRRRMHDGIDMPMPKGTPIAAALDGVVLETATNSTRNYRGYGNTVVIDHGNGIVTLYAHCSKLNVKKGQRVRQGETVAFVGRTGRSTTNHVHFEVRKNGTAVNPIPYLTPR